MWLGTCSCLPCICSPCFICCIEKPKSENDGVDICGPWRWDCCPCPCCGPVGACHWYWGGCCFSACDSQYGLFRATHAPGRPWCCEDKSDCKDCACFDVDEATRACKICDSCFGVGLCCYFVQPWCWCCACWGVACAGWGESWGENRKRWAIKNGASTRARGQGARRHTDYGISLRQARAPATRGATPAARAARTAARSTTGTTSARRAGHVTRPHARPSHHSISPVDPPSVAIASRLCCAGLEVFSEKHKGAKAQAAAAEASASKSKGAQKKQDACRFPSPAPHLFPASYFRRRFSLLPPRVARVSPAAPPNTLLCPLLRAGAACSPTRHPRRPPAKARPGGDPVAASAKRRLNTINVAPCAPHPSSMPHTTATAISPVRDSPTTICACGCPQGMHPC